MRIPITDVLTILAGEKTAQEVFAGYGVGPPNPLKLFQQALASERHLESVELIETDPLTRAQPQLAFRFVEGKEPVIARAKADEGDEKSSARSPESRE